MPERADALDRVRLGDVGILIVSHLLTERPRLDRLYTLIDGRAVGE